MVEKMIFSLQDQLTWLTGKSPFFNREYIFNRSIFQPAMLVYQRVQNFVSKPNSVFLLVSKSGPKPKAEKKSKTFWMIKRL